MELKEKRKKSIVVCLTVIYSLSFILMNIGYFTPVWVSALSGFFSVNPWLLKCDSTGLVSGWCRYDLLDLGTNVGNYGKTILVVLCICCFNFGALSTIFKH